MKISFENDMLRDCCCVFDLGEEHFGLHLAKLVFNMVAEAEAAENVVEWHGILVDDLIQCGPDTFQIAVGTDYVAQFVPAGQKYKVNEAGQADWASVTRLKLTAIRRRI